MNTYLKKTPLLLAVLGAVLLTGCSTSVSFSAARKASVRSASVVKRSQYPEKEKVMIYTFGQNMAGALGGAIGAVAAAAAGQDDRSQFAAYLKTQGIDPGLIMANAFESELRKAPLWPESTAASDATFEFKIGVVGLMIRHGFTTKLSPYLAAEGKLVRRDGNVLWQRTSFVRDGDVQHSLDEYLKTPGVLRSALDIAARRLSQDFIAELHVQSGGRNPVEAAERAAEKAEEERELALEREQDERDRQAAERKAQERALKRAQRKRS